MNLDRIAEFLKPTIIISTDMVDHKDPARDPRVQIEENHLELTSLKIAVGLGSVELPEDKLAELEERHQTSEWELQFALGSIEAARVVALHQMEASEEIVGRREARVNRRGRWSSKL